MKKDKSKVNIKLEKWVIKNLYEILDFTEKELTKNVPETRGIFVKWTAMLDAIPPIRQAIVEALKQKEKDKEKRK